ATSEQPVWLAPHIRMRCPWTAKALHSWTFSAPLVHLVTPYTGVARTATESRACMQSANVRQSLSILPRRTLLHIPAASWPVVLHRDMTSIGAGRKGATPAGTGGAGVRRTSTLIPLRVAKPRLSVEA